MIVGVDAGNYQVKVVHKKGVDIFPSDIGEYRERNFEQKFSDNDMVVEYEGKKYFAGTLAKYESEFCSTMMGESKAHFDFKLRVLIALHRVGCNIYQIIVGQPIATHTKAEKQKMKDALLGHHSIIINGIKREFVIERVEVAAEGGAAFWSDPERGLVRITDIGSGTVNCATLHDLRYIDKDSFTIFVGMNTTKTKNYEALGRVIAGEASKKWGKYDKVKIVGGVAREIYPYLKEYFPNASVVLPLLDGRVLEPVFANAIGFYQIGAGIYDGC